MQIILLAVPEGSKVLRAEVCFLMDCTSSMQSWIEATKSKLVAIMQDLRRQFESQIQGLALEVRVAFVGYRDFCDKEQFVVKDFTDNIEEMVQFIGQLKASGGGDAAEDVYGGLEKTTSLSWTGRGKIKVARRIIHFADAPGHGARYNTFNANNDHHSDFDSDGAKCMKVMKQIAELRIDFTFVRITNNTDKMIEVFKKWYDGKVTGHLEMQVLPLEAPAESFGANITQIILSSVKSVACTIK